MGGWHGTPASSLLRRRGRCRQLDSCRRAQVEYLPAVAQPANPRPRRGSRRSTDASQLSRNRVDAGRQSLSRPRTDGAGSGGSGQEAALRAVQPARPTFALGFISGAEISLLPVVDRTLRDEFAGIDIRLSSEYSPVLAKALMRRRLDAAFMR